MEKTYKDDMRTLISNQSSVWMVGRGQSASLVSVSEVVVHKRGLEFVSSLPYHVWTELVIAFSPYGKGSRQNFTGVVISCEGNKGSGYKISMAFTAMSRQTQAMLCSIAARQ
jgi:hypothetical protein